MKFYAVKAGKKVGVFDNWTECNESIKGFSGAIYKSFPSKEEAEAFLSDRDIWRETVVKAPSQFEQACETCGLAGGFAYSRNEENPSFLELC